MQKSLLVALLVFLILFLAGCTSIEQKKCEEIPKTHKCPDVVGYNVLTCKSTEPDICFHERAVAHAIKGGIASTAGDTQGFQSERQLALGDCAQITGSGVTEPGGPYQGLCYADVAEKLKDQSVCELVRGRTILRIGEGAAKEACRQRAEKISPVCEPALIVFASLLSVAFVFRRKG